MDKLIAQQKLTLKRILGATTKPVTIYTEAMVYACLNLEPPIEFANKRRAENMGRLQEALNAIPGLNQSEFLARGTGRTTKRVVHAVVLSQSQFVNMIGHTAKHSNELKNMARRFCEQLDLDPDKIIAIPRERTIGRHDIVEVID